MGPLKYTWTDHIRGSAHLVVGAEVEQPPWWVHKVGEVVEEAQTSPHCLHAHLLQPAVLRRHCQREAQLERNRRAWERGRQMELNDKFILYLMRHFGRLQHENARCWKQGTRCVCMCARVYVCMPLTWCSWRHRRCRPGSAVAASSRDLVDMFPLQHRHHGGLPDMVGVSKTQLDRGERKQHVPISDLAPRLWNEFIIYLTEPRVMMRVKCH